MNEELRRREAGLRAEAERLAGDGLFENAVSIYRRCAELGRELGDSILVDSALCNAAYLSVFLGEGTRHLTFLREVLLRNSGTLVSWQAAYALAYFYEVSKEFRKAAFYAKIAVDKARQLQDTDRLAGSLNQLGSAQLACSSLAEARECYRAAIAAGTPGSVAHGNFLVNLGYTALLNREPAQGVRLLLRGLRILRRGRKMEAILGAHLDLAHAYLDLGRWRYAAKHALSALRGAERVGLNEISKKALFLAGEAARHAGALGEAETFYQRLQDEFYPAQPYLPILLMSVDVRGMVNLHA